MDVTGADELGEQDESAENGGEPRVFRLPRETARHVGAPDDS